MIMTALQTKTASCFSQSKLKKFNSANKPYDNRSCFKTQNLLVSKKI